MAAARSGSVDSRFSAVVGVQLVQAVLRGVGPSGKAIAVFDQKTGVVGER